jgi:hypothetical protein
MAQGVPAGALTPAALKQTLMTNYIDFADAGANSANWAQQYLPDLMEKEAEIFGNRTISGFLSQVGAEESMSSDQVIWSEQGRLHISYKDVFLTANGGTATVGTLHFNAGTTDVDGNAVTASTAGACPHAVRAGDMILVADADSVTRGYVTSVATSGSGVANHAVTWKRYDGGNIASGSLAENQDVTILVYGSEYAKGTIGRESANKPQFKSRTNKPIILKDKYEISGSDAAQIGWVEVSGEEGQSGYMWYLKASGDTKARFNDYLEMAMLESTKAAAATTGAHQGGNFAGTEGLWAALADRGNISDALDGSPSHIVALAEFDGIIAELDKQGAIEENMMFVNRNVALNIDDMLAGANGGIGGTVAAPLYGTSYGVFNNDADMALNLGFSGFRRGSYDFYKSDFKYLNDASTRGLINDALTTANTAQITGVMIPAGVSSVYDQNLGKNLKRPFLHVRYRASNMESRKYKTWTTGSVGAVTSDLDAMEMHFLSERCLVVQGANNFVLLKGLAAGAFN